MLAFGLMGNPEFEVLRAVVVLDAVNVMNILTGEEITAESLAHYLTMLGVARRLPARRALLWR